jgi:very-short-patch-repair endonuclease
LDFAQPVLKVGIELDGVSHRGALSAERERKKDAVLAKLGWRVIRIKHK